MLLFEPSVEFFIKGALQRMFFAYDAGTTAHIINRAIPAAWTDVINEGLLFLKPVLPQFILPDIKAGIAPALPISLFEQRIAAVGLALRIMGIQPSYQHHKNPLVA